MKYLFSDFYFLCGAADKETRTVGDAYRKMCDYLAAPASCGCLLHALRGLSAGGYITVSPEDGIISAATPLSVTDSGKKAVAISGIQKMLGEVKAFKKNELRFCALERPAVTVGEDRVAETEGFAEIAESMMRQGEISYPLFELTDVGDGHLRLTLHDANDGCTSDSEDEDCDPDAAESAHSVTITGDAERIMQGMSDLLSAAHALLTEPPRTRKVALHGADKSLIVTLAQAAGEQGTILRMTVAQIRFNRQRFYGKRDGDLDYAQCGEPIITVELSDVSGFAVLMLPCMVAMPERLSSTDLEIIDALHKFLK